MATLIHSDGCTETVKPKNGRYFSLAELQGYVDGYIELTRVNDGRAMIVNEEGKLHGLPYNATATKMHRYDDPIVGDVLVCESGELR